MNRYFLDARDMEHPYPLERAIAILRELDNSSYLYMLHRKYPTPLIALANEHNLNHKSLQIAKEWHILITPNQDVKLEEYIKEDICLDNSKDYH